MYCQRENRVCQNDSIFITSQEQSVGTNFVNSLNESSAFLGEGAAKDQQGGLVSTL